MGRVGPRRPVGADGRRAWPVALVALVVTVLALAGCGGDDATPAAAPAPSLSASHDMAGTAGMAGMGHGSATATPASSPLRSGERFVDVGMSADYTPAPPNGGTDDYRCFVVDPKLTRPTFLTGSQFLPDNPEILHHAIFFKLDRKDVATARAKEAQTPGYGWTCFTGTGLDTSLGGALRNAPWLAAWAPGGGETTTARGTGFRMEPGDQIIMQIHYNLLATGGTATGTDRSGMRLRFADGARLEPLHTTLLVAPIELPCTKAESGPLCDRDASVLDTMKRFGDASGAQVAGLNFLCNAGAPPRPGNTQHCDRTMRQRMVVYAVAGHMHLLGRSIRVDQNPGTAGARTLLDVKNYDFDNQAARPLAAPATVQAGDDLRVTCTHDARLRSQLPALKSLKPRYVVWGEGTSDEMCLGVVIWAARKA